MSVTYNVILAETALRINALTGATAANLQTAYVTSPLTTTQFQSTIFNFQSVKDAILDAEGRLAWAIADTGDHPWRQYIASTTANQATTSTLPSTSTGSKPIIGIWGAVVDATDSIVCSQMPLDMVRRRVANAGTAYVCPVYWYNITGGRIEHTRTNVKVECCIYSRSDQSTSFDANGNILLPDGLAQAYWCGALATLMRDDEFTDQANKYSAYFDGAIQSIRGGLTSVQGAVPTP